ncbi:MAG: Peroxiredoxin Bcp [Rhodocyclaceae bacterium]|nr:MAG: peroxiredoxin [Rhodocyclaceae bacterium]MBV6407932.1 Peroxiredoxin Bcp [Rhodocyclaceae bacterium]CAG0934006.1 glutathione peroxidase [Rhodocyclaceae bacterium]
MRPEPGDPAPDFSCPATDGSTLRLSDFRGKKLVLYFYPMDDTPGCTAQACSLRDFNRDIAAKGAAILGVSSQDEASHKKFTSKHKLNFPLLADTGRSVAKAYGVAGSGLFGVARALTGMNERVTFIIDEKGKVAHVLDDPDCPNHGEEVLKFL